VKLHDNIQEKAAGKVAGGILKLQRSFASVMHKVSASWKKQHKVIFLALISILFLYFSIDAIRKPFQLKGNAKKTGVMVTPKMMPVEDMPTVTTEEFRKIQELKKTLDSNIIRQRPGLMDSIALVEGLFYSQQK